MTIVRLGSGLGGDDIGVESSRTTGQVTHHISPDVDAERNCSSPINGKRLQRRSSGFDKFTPELEGRNGGGDAWRTDGRLAIVICQQRKPRASRSRRPKQSHTGINADGVCFCSVTQRSVRQPMPNSLRMIMARVRMATPVRHFRIKLKRHHPNRAGSCRSRK